MSRSVPRIGRILDVVSALFFLSGALLYGWTWFELRAEQLSPAQPVGEGVAFTAVARVEHLHRLGDQGLILMALGALIAVVAAVAARRIGASDSSEVSPDVAPAAEESTP